jgi:hypothetical protein
MSNNLAFRKDIIQKSAELTSKNLDMVRLTNATMTREPKTKPRPKKKIIDHSKKRAIEYRIRQMELKYLNTAEDPYSRKMFIKQIGKREEEKVIKGEGLSDSFMESILKKCGDIVKWRRPLDQYGKPVSFGIVEFKEVMGIIRSMKLLNGQVFKGKRLEIRMSKKPKDLVCKVNKLSTWRSFKKRFKVKKRRRWTRRT